MDWKGRTITWLICIGLFVVAMLIYFHPALEGKVIQKGDHLNSMANSQEIYEHREEFGEEALWTNSQFGGMPTFQMNTRFPSNLIKSVKTWITIKPLFPAGTGLIFTLFLGFFIMLLVMKVDPWLALIGSFAYAFSTYFFTSFEAGHTGKLRVIGFIAPCIATIFMALRGRWLLGGSLTAFTVSAALGSNHLQISYYLAIFIVIIMIVEGFAAFKEGRISPYFYSAGTLLLAAILAIGPNVSSMWSTYSYSQETIRGGSSPLHKGKEDQGGGLDKDYAMRWSYGKAESFNLMIPSLYGGGSNTHPDKDSKTAQALKQRGATGTRLERTLQQLPMYWGEQPFTSGPVYLGAVVCFLFIAGFFLVSGALRWWVFISSVLVLMMAWGRHFSVLNDLLFEHFPFYSKFRSPSMTLTLICFTAPLMGTMAVQELIRGRDREKTLKGFQWAFYITGGSCLFFALFGPSLFEFEGPMSGRLEQAGFLESLKEDRASMLQQSAIRSFIFIGLAFLAVWAYIKGHLQNRYLLLGIGALVVVDLWSVNKDYVNAEDFTDADDSTPREFRKTQADRRILQGKENAFYPAGPEGPTTPSQHYRVYNTIPRDPFADAFTSYHHHSIGGYHAAKLIRYQDLFERQIKKGNRQVLDMLNTRWFIVKGEKSKAREVARKNPNALGNAWYVDRIKWARNAEEEMSALGKGGAIQEAIDPSKTAIIHQEFEDYFTERPEQTQNRGSKIELTSYKANHLRYNASVNGDQGKLAVFSEVYYEGSGNDWKARIDGKKVPHIRVNYALRGLWIPPGDHKVEFEFKPTPYYTGENIALASSILIYLLIALSAFYEKRKQKAEGIAASGEEDDQQ